MTIKSRQPENCGGHYTTSEILLLRDIPLKGTFRIVSDCVASDLPHIVNTSVLSGVCSQTDQSHRITGSSPTSPVWVKDQLF